MALVIPVWMALGWLLGAAFGHAVHALLRDDAPQALPRPIKPLGPLGVDPPLQAATAAVFGLLAWRLPLGVALPIYGLYAAALLALLVVDWRTRYVYDTMVYPAIAVAVALTPVARQGPLWQGLAGALIGLACFGLIYLLGRLVYRGRTPMGAGDISLAALLGAVAGHERAVAALLLASLLGAGLALAYWARYRSLRVFMPYGPALCLAGLLTLVLNP